MKMVRAILLGTMVPCSPILPLIGSRVMTRSSHSFPKGSAGSGLRLALGVAGVTSGVSGLAFGLQTSPRWSLPLPFKRNISMCEARPGCKVSVVQYNVLSSHLCEPEHFNKCDPDALYPPARLQEVERRLEEEVKKGSIVCLQEVSTEWAGKLHVFFANRGYHFVTAPYGRKFNGYMGVAMAWPVDVYQAQEVELPRLADTKSWPSLPPPPPPSWWRRYILYLWPSKQSKPPFNSWKEAQKRNNILLCARLKHVQSGEVLCVGTYHMPCLFGSDAKCQTMVVHAALAVQFLQKFAAGQPLIFAGDFNFKPHDCMYSMLTTGTLDPQHPMYPPVPECDEWNVDTEPMNSAYARALGSEPPFTNYAITKWSSEAFIETLDYIFVSPHWKVSGVRQLPSAEAVKGPLPNMGEPSDHLQLQADLELEGEKQ